MKDIQKLLTLLNELDEGLSHCMHCGLCQSVCPVFARSLKESDVARGKLYLLEGLLSKLIKDPRGVSSRLENCLLCGSCASNCPSGVDSLEIFLKARVILATYLGLSKAKRLILRGMLAHPYLFNTIIEIGAACQGMFTHKGSEILGTSCSIMTELFLGQNRHFKPFAKEQFHKRERPRNTDDKGSGFKVAFYYGCLVDKVFPGIGEAVLEILSHHGVGIYMPDDQVCCGIPAVSSGDIQTFEKLLVMNMKVFLRKEFDILVTPCATCTATIKKLWPLFSKRFTESRRKEIEKLSAKTMDINSFLAEKLDIKAGKTNAGAVKVAYHDPCHLKKTLGVSEPPRFVIKSNPDYELVEMKECDYCCGNGGTFNLKNYSTSIEIANRKRDNIISSGVGIVATSCPACIMQISDVLSQHGDRIKVVHPVEIYTDGLN